MKNKRNLLGKVLALLLSAVLVTGMFGGVAAEAKEISIPPPKISISYTKDDIAAKVTFGKTKDADGYEIYILGMGDMYTDYKEAPIDWVTTGNGGFKFTQKVEQNGKKKRTVTLTMLSPGTYKIKVRSYNEKKYGAVVFSEYTKEKTFTVKQAAPGYKSKYDFSKVKKGDVITFGAFEQDGDFSNGKEPVEWIVLDKNKKQMLVMSRNALDCIPYDMPSENTSEYYRARTWEICSLRKWLNSEFYNAAFNKAEQKLIKTTTVENFDNVISKVSGGDDTKDKVFLLSQLEMINSDYGFAEEYDTHDEARRCVPTAYAISQGAYSTIGYQETERHCWWWLRSPGSIETKAMIVGIPGNLDDEGVASAMIAVRPAMWISVK
ncbi:MAG: fibronectin type III domain-containing protein [Lachnospiraceae bacterium]|nr:fibronectin type III domain-containing protein [Lachnospiraceae bacterium]